MKQSIFTALANSFGSKQQSSAGIRTLTAAEVAAVAGGPEEPHDPLPRLVAIDPPKA